MLAPTFDLPIIGGCYPAPSNGFKVIPLGHGKSADWDNLESVSTRIHGLKHQVVVIQVLVRHTQANRKGPGLART